MIYDQFVYGNEIVNRLLMCQINQPMQQSSKYGRRCTKSKHSNTIKHIHILATNHPDLQLLIRRIVNKKEEGKEKQFRRM
jgi:hypothetical protein